ncbi:MAG: hypothetical protein Q9209_007041 [Squamulea sp. 1 TL-2023]
MQNLPFEIMTNIAGYIDSDTEREALRNLRCTCWDWAYAAAPHLFKKVHIWLERDSLRKLVDVSEHSTYSQCINQITLGSERLNPYAYNSAWKPEPDRGPLPDGYASDIIELYEWANLFDHEKLYSWANGFFEEDPQRCEPEDFIVLARRLVDHLEYQKQMEEEGLGVKILATAMKKLPKLSIIRFDHDDDSPGTSELISEGFTVRNPGIEWRRDVLQVGLQALVQAGCKPQAIETVNRHGNYYLPGWVFGDVDIKLSNFPLHDLLQNLQVLRIDQPQRNWEIWYPPIPLSHAKALGLFLERAPQLGELYLSFGCALIGDAFPVIFERIQSKKLREITLASAQVDQTDLANWLSSHSASLREIRLVLIGLTGTQWDQFVDKMRQKASWPCLSFVSLENVKVWAPEHGNRLWNWKYGPLPLVGYLKGASETNPYHRYHPAWFPELFN